MKCNDCKYFELTTYKNTGYCRLWDAIMHEDDECEDGEELE